jgi:GTP-binding protein
MLRDEAEIEVRSGAGGNGAVSFWREKYVAEGGPDGGDGGDGGDIILQASHHLNTLMSYCRKRHYRAEDGNPGTGGHCSGKSGEDCVLEVPCGTIVRLAQTGEILADLTDHGQQVIVAAGGHGGKGNARFKSSTNQTPMQSTPGGRGITYQLKLELKLIADVGIMGFPNAGKSTLLSRLSKARPKIAPYPFTTLEPQLGVIERSDRTLILADIPGLIEGAAEGRGLGHQFLRHVERCPILLHLVDGSEGDLKALKSRIQVLNRELERFAPELSAKRQLIVLNKADARPDLETIRGKLAKSLKSEVLVISGVSGQGLDALADRLLHIVASAGNVEA